jgi:hypothetical protein
MFFCVYSVFVLSCVGSGLATGWSPSKQSYRLSVRLKNWSETKRFTDALCSKWEQQECEWWINDRLWVHKSTVNGSRWCPRRNHSATQLMHDTVKVNAEINMCTLDVCPTEPHISVMHRNGHYRIARRCRDIPVYGRASAVLLHWRMTYDVWSEWRWLNIKYNDPISFCCQKDSYP